jgi:prepilin-type N-terminal cleavage/methylation domain-containing protein
MDGRGTPLPTGESNKHKHQKLENMNIRKSNASAFTLVEVCVSMAILSMILASFYVGLIWGLGQTRQTRENLRANQIVVEKMDVLRLYNWNQLVYSNMLSPNFVDYYSPNDANVGVAYYGTVTIVQPTLSADYNTNMRVVTVSLSWTNSNNMPFNRSVSTFVAKSGIQNYTYSH